LLAAAMFASATPALAQVRLSESTGVNLFNNNCTSCHGNPPVENAPTQVVIRQMPPERIYEAITTGAMKNMAQKLSDDDKRLLAEYMGGRKLDKGDAGDAKNMPNVCANHPPVKDLTAPAWNGWSDLSNTRFQPAKAAGLSAGQVSRLTLKWAFGFPGATALYGETVVDGRVYVSSNAGYVYSLDAETGCVHWSFHSAAVVRSGVTVGTAEAGSRRVVAYFETFAGMSTRWMRRTVNLSGRPRPIRSRWLGSRETPGFTRAVCTYRSLLWKRTSRGVPCMSAAPSGAPSWRWMRRPGNRSGRPTRSPNSRSSLRKIR
jgi:cytochrome c553